MNKLSKLEEQDYTEIKCGQKTYEEVKVGEEQIEVVEHFKYLGSLKSASAKYIKDIIISRFGMAKKRMLELVHMTKADEKRIKSAERRIYRRMLRISWTEHCFGHTT